MFKWLMPLLNIKQSEARLVKQLFLIQFVLGIATAFLNISSLTLFIDILKARNFPKVFIIAAVLLVFLNIGYAYFEKRKNSVELLQLIIVFSGTILLVLAIGIWALDAPALIMVLAVWNLLIYMLIGYAFWGMAAMMFSVRESKRIFSIVGAGDIPAKLLGYTSAAVFTNVIFIHHHDMGIKIMIWISILALVGAYILISDFSKHSTVEHGEEAAHHPIVSASKRSILERIFENKLILSISMLTVFASIAFYFIDFTFLSEIKEKYGHQGEIASFFAAFFALGRAVAILIKFVFSSRMIARMGLTNVLLLSPVILLIVDATIIFSNDSSQRYLYIFGSMVLTMEILRSVVQEPVFFVLFQPLTPHDRLKGHLIAKGYTLPVALSFVGGFLLVYQQNHEGIHIPFIGTVISVALILWIATVYFVKGEYMSTLLHSIKKGYFTGEDMFLNDSSVTGVLLSRLKSHSTIEVISALNLLERSQYNDKHKLFLNQLQHSPFLEVQTYVLNRIIDNNMAGMLPIIKSSLEQDTELKPALTKALFYLEEKDIAKWKKELEQLDSNSKKEAIIGLLLRDDKEVSDMVCNELLGLITGNDESEALLVCTIIVEAGKGRYTDVLEALLSQPSIKVVSKAVEAAGKLKEFLVYNRVIEVCLQYNLHYSLQRSLTGYGDKVFSDGYITAESVSPAALPFVITAASKIKGPYSEAFLVDLIQQHNPYGDKVIDALWKKKGVADKTVIETWMETKLNDVLEKTNSLKSLLHYEHTSLLQQAVTSEIHQDVEILLKGAALIFNRDLITRFLEIFKQNDGHKIANALELLELTIHKKYFIVLNEIVELSMDMKRKKMIAPLHKHHEEHDILKDIIVNHKNNFTSWTRSIAVYTIPKMHNKEEALLALRSCNDGDFLFRETKNYVLSILK